MPNHSLYKIFYGDELVYIGRTEQPIARRLHGHFFGKPMHRKIHMPSVSRIEVAECASTADMYLYEVYLINLLKPPYNRDDKATDSLTVELPELVFEKYEPLLFERWLLKINKIENKEIAGEAELVKWEQERASARSRLRGEAWHTWCEANPKPC